MKANFFRRTILLLAIVISFSVSACKSSLDSIAYHPFTPYQKSLVKQLRKSGVQVIKQAEVLQLVIPTDAFFYPQTTQLRRRRIDMIGVAASLVKSYIAYYKAPRMYVSGYTDGVFPRTTRRVLSEMYAKVIAAQLWENGVPQKNMRVKGYGARYPIGDNQTAAGSAYNRRVVIRIN
jgi:outer membrane protein OmpA-like peptidoglycan-associated protein